MAKKITDTDRFITFAQTEPLDKVETVLGIVKTIVANRRKNASPATNEAPKPRAARRVKAAEAPLAAQAQSAEGGIMFEAAN